MHPVQLIVVGGGSRGTGYAGYALEHPDQVRIVGVAEPRDFNRDRIATQHGIRPDCVFTDWREVAARPKFADGVIIATQDAMHADPAVAFADMGYHILLEKPMAPNEADCRRIVEVVLANHIVFAVCHVLRYTPYTQALKSVVDSGRIGDVVSIQHLESVGYWHQAHSYVRGNWRSERGSSPMLLAKSCHDMDWIRYITGKRCIQVASFGSLRHFHSGEKPEGAGERCLECGIEPACPYSAPQIYLGMVREGRTGWPLDVLAPDPSEQGVLEAIRTGPYGRCVYSCDNDVVDHQVVSMRFEDGTTGSFTMTAFTRTRDRESRIFGTRGEIYGNGETIDVYDFLTDRTDRLNVTAHSDGSILGGHGGGDGAIMREFVAAIAHDDPSLILSGPEESLETHLMVFAAEKARREGRVVDVRI